MEITETIARKVLEVVDAGLVNGLGQAFSHGGNPMRYTVASQLTPTQSAALAQAQEADLLAAAAMVKFDIANHENSSVVPIASAALFTAERKRDAAALAFVRTFQREG